LRESDAINRPTGWPGKADVNLFASRAGTAIWGQGSTLAYCSLLSQLK